jgi:hypothetical protein
MTDKRPVRIIQATDFRNGPAVHYHGAQNSDVRTVIVRHGKPILELKPLDDETRAEASKALRALRRKQSRSHSKAVAERAAA